MSDLDRLTAALALGYRIERELGAGGMATVYLAHDLKHDRDVAIKVLHPDLGAALGGERFLSEIRTTARLQHPHILPLLDSGEADGLLYYVMPLVTGETLRIRLERERQLPIADALRIAREAASALDYAHRQGVIHRDIKPENILLHDGQAIVADFGIALAVQSAGGQRMTQTGLSLGTPQYMSPEQAMGERTIDARSDIYALGAVTYEMLVGEAPFIGNSVQAIVARVLTEEPRAISVQRKAVPAGMEQAVMRALEKLPADRFESAKEFVDALGREGQSTARTGATAASAHTSRGLLAGTALLALVGGLGWFAWWRATRGDRAADALPLRFTIEQPSGASIGDGNAFAMDISSAARRVAFIARDSAGVARVYVRAFDDVRSQRLDGTEGVSVLFFSPDGAWIAFVGNDKLKKIPATGGNAIVLADYGDRPSGGAWSSDGHIYIPAERSILVIPANGGVAQSLGTLVEAGRYVRAPRVLVGGTTVLFTDWSGVSATARIMAYSLPEKSFAPLGVEGSIALGVRDTLLIYSDASGAINSVPYDATRRTVRGEIRQLINSVARSAGMPRAALAADGSLAYFLGEQTNALTLVGPGDAVESLRGGLDAASEPRVSPDGKRIVMFSNAVSDVRTYDVEARSLTRNAFGPANETVYSRPEWMADGALLLRAESGAERAVLVLQAANDRGVPAVLHRDAQNSLWEGVGSPDGQYLLYRVGTGREADLRYRRMTGDTASRPFAATPAREQEARFSPNGQLVAYTSEEAGEGSCARFPTARGRTGSPRQAGGSPCGHVTGNRYTTSRATGSCSVRVLISPRVRVMMHQPGPCEPSRDPV